MGGWSLHGWLEPEGAVRSVDASRRGKKPSLPGASGATLATPGCSPRGRLGFCLPGL